MPNIRAVDADAICFFSFLLDLAEVDLSTFALKSGKRKKKKERISKTIKIS